MYIYVYIYINTYTLTYAYIFLYMRKRVCMCAFTYINVCLLDCVLVELFPQEDAEAGSREGLLHPASLLLFAKGASLTD